MKKHSGASRLSFICPRCEIEQHDIVIEQCYLLSDPEERTTFFRCNSCGEVLLDEEARTCEHQTLATLLGEMEQARNRQRKLDILGSFIFWLMVVQLIWCWCQ